MSEGSPISEEYFDDDVVSAARTIQNLNPRMSWTEAYERALRQHAVKTGRPIIRSRP
jgi:hypothetical protein